LRPPLPILEATRKPYCTDGDGCVAAAGQLLAVKALSSQLFLYVGAQRKAKGGSPSLANLFFQNMYLFNNIKAV
jgi:hypothetical protein